MKRRSGVFVFVGALGFLVQILAVAGLTRAAHWHHAAATAVAVELAVLHNFCWHERWTWHDRIRSSAGTAQRLVRFHALNGLTSIASNVAMTTALVEMYRLDPIAANVIAVGLTSVANFLIADVWVFRAVRNETAVTARFFASSALRDEESEKFTEFRRDEAR
jgi:putative flippase GtrA